LATPEAEKLKQKWAELKKLPPEKKPDADD
jgi:hypothetical protein